MRIDESRQDHPILRIDDLDVARQLPFDFVGTAGRDDHPVAHQHPAVWMMARSPSSFPTAAVWDRRV